MFIGKLNPNGPDIFYVGISIGTQQAVQLAHGTAHICPPIRRGDLAMLTTIEGQPGNVFIVDGLFFGTQSVSLKEIRVLLRRGWCIVGASSIGALRALEAGSSGMVGFGRVYRWMRLYQVEDDDEVAQVIDAGTFQALSLAMIDIRAFLHLLVRTGLITRAEGSVVMCSMKELFFPDRNSTALVGLLCQKRPGDSNWRELMKRLLAEFHLPKQQDARDLIRKVKEYRSHVHE